MMKTDMGKKACSIRLATPEDAEALLEIFRPYVLHTAIAFEHEPPTPEAFRATMEQCLLRYPYLIAEDRGVPVGYAYASPFKKRAAYDWAVETSIYVRQGCAGNGYGRQLYEELERLLKAQNILSMYACIAYTDHEDPYLTNNSMHFHAHLGYELTAKFPCCGFKFQRWYDIIWMHKEIGPHDGPPSPVIPITELFR